jgi:hypothetical protein
MNVLPTSPARTADLGAGATTPPGDFLALLTATLGTDARRSGDGGPDLPAAPSGAGIGRDEVDDATAPAWLTLALAPTVAPRTGTAGAGAVTAHDGLAGGDVAARSDGTEAPPPAGSAPTLPLAEAQLTESPPAAWATLEAPAAAVPAGAVPAGEVPAGEVLADEVSVAGPAASAPNPEVGHDAPEGQLGPHAPAGAPATGPDTAAAEPTGLQQAAAEGAAPRPAGPPETAAGSRGEPTGPRGRPLIAGGDRPGRPDAGPPEVATRSAGVPTAVTEPAPVDGTPLTSAERSAEPRTSPAQGSTAASIARILDALELLEQAPPPRQLTLELGDLRVRLALEDGTVRLQLLGEQREAGRDLLREAAAELRARGYDLGEGHRDGAPSDRRESATRTEQPERSTRSDTPSTTPRRPTGGGIHL